MNTFISLKHLLSLNYLPFPFIDHAISARLSFSGRTQRSRICPQASVIAICCLATAKALPSGIGGLGGGSYGGGSYGGGGGGSSGGQVQLDGVPDIESYGGISYPNYNIIDLGEYAKGHVPGDEIKISRDSKITIPSPYPVKIPVPQPYPVPVDKPYPVVETKYVKVPYPVTQVLEKKVPYPVEVPKPYPVPISSGDGGQGLGGGLGGGFGGSFGGHQALEGNGYGVQESGVDLPANEGYDAGIGGGASASSYDARALEEQSYSGGAETGGWQPLGDVH
ncbi:hypothetical protein GWI33_015000 [Rhynchophorus ferrugineus]|uniref:Uncharacterized protein n=1 Tax=Rhynchophorus ferrugineus TaxID=354439 RepID=A0A834IE43_RHYFE|nr:hypothetical protein GWI33_015000 [Rhynchophorus ferrugineus]